ncbi:MAG: alpha/beta hydrolase family protein [Thermoguttaceae bacterium]
MKANRIKPLLTLTRISHQLDTFHKTVPLLRRSSALYLVTRLCLGTCNRFTLLALRQALAHVGEKCRLIVWIFSIAVAATTMATADETLPGAQRQNVSITREYAVASSYYRLFDAARLREVPVKIYYPAAGKGPFPVVLFSPGLGRSRDDCAYLGTHWAARGYVAVFLQHRGSDDAVWRGKLQPIKHLKAAYKNPATMRNRAQDMRFTLDQLERLQLHGPLAMRLDLDRIGAAGCDLGAETALALAGQILPGGLITSDKRVKAVAAMSPPVPMQQMPWELVYEGIHVPCLFVTGSEDDGLIGATKAWQRRLPFDNTFGADQYLVTLLGADHMVYAGHILRQREAEKDAYFQTQIRDATTLFWDAYLKEKPQAILSLQADGLSKVLGPNATVEKKLAVSGKN